MTPEDRKELAELILNGAPFGRILFRLCELGQRSNSLDTREISGRIEEMMDSYGESFKETLQ